MENSNSVVHSGSGGVREMISVALPMVVSSACDTAMMFTDRLFLSRLGQEEMAASMGGGMSAFMFFSFFWGLLGYSTAVTANYYGAGEKAKCPSVTFQSFLISLGAYPILLLMIPLGLYFFRNSGIDETQLAYQIPYFKILMVGSIFALMRSVFSGFFTGLGRTNVIMIASVSAMVINAAVSYVLIFGKMSMPPLGIVGAAYGTLIGSVSSVAIMAYSYRRFTRAENMPLRTAFVYNKEILMKIVKFGFPAGLEFFLAMSAFTVMIFMFHARGIETASAVTIVFNWDHVAYVPLVGLEIGVTSLFGRYIGAGRPDIAHKSLISGIKTGTLYSLIVAVLFVAFPGVLTDIFRPENGGEAFAHTRELSIFMIRAAAIYVAVETFIVVYAGALRGAGDTYWAMFIMVGIMWVLTGVMYLMLHVYLMPLKAAWVFMVLMFMCIPLFMYIRYRTGGWKKINPISA